MSDPDDPMEQLRSAWVAQTVEVRRYTPEELQERNVSFARSLRRRNLVEALAGLFVIGSFGAIAALAGDPLMRVASALIAVGAAVSVGSLLLRGHPEPPSAALGTLAWRRRTLETQRALLASVWWWYLGPLVPGMALFVVARLRLAHGPEGVLLASVVAAVIAGVFAWVARLNEVAAAELARELAELEGED